MPIAQQYIDGAQAAQRKWGPPASAMLGQAMLEAGPNFDEIPKGSNNILGVQALPGLQSVESLSFEYVDRARVTKVEHFAAFKSIAECFDRYGQLIASGASGTPYARAMACLHVAGGVPTPKQVDDYINALASEYASAQEPPKGQETYSEIVVGIIEARGLYQYDIAGPTSAQIAARVKAANGIPIPVIASGPNVRIVTIKTPISLAVSHETFAKEFEEWLAKYLPW